MSLNPLESQVAAASDLPPQDRLEARWAAFEQAHATSLQRPPTPSQRSDVAEWLRARRAENDDAFVVRDRRLRWLAHRTPGEKANILVQAACNACEVVVGEDGTNPLHLVAPIDVEPWSAQSTTDKVAIREAVTAAMKQRNLHQPLPDQRLCLTVLSFVPSARGRMDVDNLVKGLLDALQGVLYVNDWQVQCLTSRRLLTRASTGAYLMSARLVYPYEADVVHDDGRPLNIISGPRIGPGPVFDGVRVGRPATDALIEAGYTLLADLPENLDDLLALHGVGPKAVRLLRDTRGR